MITLYRLAEQLPVLVMVTLIDFELHGRILRLSHRYCGSSKKFFFLINGWLIIMREGHTVHLLFHFPIKNT